MKVSISSGGGDGEGEDEDEEHSVGVGSIWEFGGDMLSSELNIQS